MKDPIDNSSFTGSWDELMTLGDQFKGKQIRVEVIDQSDPASYQSRFRAWRRKARALLAEDDTQRPIKGEFKNLYDQILVEKFRKQGLDL